MTDRGAVRCGYNLDPVATSASAARNFEAAEMHGHAFGVDLDAVGFGDAEIGGEIVTSPPD